eukprot:SAG31_NODE_170_length_21415_cov_8.230813_10_plen_143_part_00
MCARLVALLMPCLLGGGALADEHPFAPLVRWAHEQAASAGAPPNPNLPSTNFSEGCLASLDELVGVHPHGREAATAPGQGLPSQLTSGYTLLFAEATAKYAFSGEGCCFLVFVQLFEKYGTLIERNTALIEKVSPCRGHAEL